MKVLSAILLSATLSFVSAQTINVTGDLDFGMMNISAPTNFTTGGEVEVSNTTDMPMNTTDMPVIDVDVGTPSPTEEMTMEETFAETSSPTEEMTVEGTFVETFEESTEAPTTTMTVGMEDVNTTAELDEVLETSPTTNETTDDILNEIEDLFDSTQAPVMAPTAEPPVATEIPVEDDLEDPDDVPTNTDTPPVETLAPNTCAVEEGATGEACGELLATTTALCDCYNFCDGILISCWDYGESTLFDCSGNIVAGCRREQAFASLSSAAVGGMTTVSLLSLLGSVFAVFAALAM